MANDPHFEVYPQRHPPEEDRDPHDPYADPNGEPTGEFGWRFRAANGQITAVAGEGFTRREDAHRAVFDFVEELTSDGLSRPIADE